MLRPDMVELGDDALLPEPGDVVVVSAPGLSVRELRAVLGDLAPDIGALATPELDDARLSEAGGVRVELAGELPQFLSAIARLWSARMAAGQRQLKTVTVELADRMVRLPADELAAGEVRTLPDKASVRRIRLDSD